MCTSTVQRAERRLRHAASLGRVLDLTERKRASHGSTTGRSGARSSRETQIEASAIQKLCVDGDSVHHRGIRIRGAHIVGQLDLSQMTLDFPLELVHCSFSDPVLLEGARLRSLRLSGCRLLGADANGRSLNCDGVRVAGSVDLDAGFDALGQVRMVAGRVEGSLDCGGATARCTPEEALYFDRLRVDGNVFLDKATVDGGISLRGSRIGGQVVCESVKLSRTGRGPVLDARGATIEGLLKFSDLSAYQGRFNLTEASTRHLHLDDHGELPPMILDGFRYVAIYPWPISGGVSVEHRLKWLESNARYVPGAYNTLAAAYRRSGFEEAAEQVLVAKQRHRRREQLARPRRLLDLALDGLVRYGFSTWRAVALLGVLLAAAAVFYSRAYPAMFSPAGQVERTPAFHPIAFASDVLLPIIDLNQSSSWIAQGWAAAVTWVLIVVGWLLSTIAVVGLTGVLAKRD